MTDSNDTTVAQLNFANPDIDIEADDQGNMTAHISISVFCDFCDFCRQPAITSFEARLKGADEAAPLHKLYVCETHVGELDERHAKALITNS